MAFEQPVHLLQPAFGRGEVNPALFGRVDLAGWAQGLRTLRNMVVRPEGSVMNRQGFSFTSNALSNTPLSTKLLPFIFSATQSYVIEVGAGSAQVLSQGAVVAGPNSIPIVGGTFLTVGSVFTIELITGSPHGLSVGQNVIISGVVGTGAFGAVINGFSQVVKVVSATQFCIPLNSAGASGNYTSGGTATAPLSFVTPWAAVDLPLLRWSQSSDTLTVVHPKYPPYEIKRTSANSFTCLPAVYTGGPFLQQNSDGVTFVYASQKSGTVTLTSTAPIFNANHVGALFQLTQQDLSNIVPWEPTKQLGTVSAVNATPIYRRASLKNYKSVSCVDTNGTDTATTGTWLPSHSQGVQADGDGGNVPTLGFGGVNWEYQDSGSGIVLITAYTSPTQVTGVVQPNYTGGPGLLPTSVVGGPQVAFGPFTFSGNGVSTSFGPLTGTTLTDPSKFYVTVGGVYQPPSLYSITAAGGSIAFLSPPPNGTNNIVVEQITALGQTTFWAFGAFSADQGYPSAVSYFPDRLVLASTPKQPVGVFGSQTSQYHQFNVSNPVVASDAFTVFLNARQLNAISDLIPLSDLLVGTSNIIWRLWAGSTGTAIGPLAIAATPQSYYGQAPTCSSLLFGDSAIFSEYDGRRLRDLIYQFAFDKFMGQELTLYSRHLIPYGTQFQRLAYKPDPLVGQLVFGSLTNGQLLACTYLREQQIIGWAHWDTQGTFEDICVVPEPSNAAGVGVNVAPTFGLYAITNRTINGVQVRYIEHQANREAPTIYDYQFTDCNVTYDGRNSTAVTMALTGTTTGQAGDVGTITASSATGWVNFQTTDPTNNNEIWIFQTFNFTGQVDEGTSGTLTKAVTPGVYILTFSDGECRAVTVAADGITCSWQGVLSKGAAPIVSATCRCRLLLTGYLTPTQATVRLRDPLPNGLIGTQTAVWTFARTVLTGASNLAGMAVVAFADANVYGISATGTAANGTLTVGLTGSLTFPSAVGVAQIGLPYLSDFETLPLNQQGVETIRMRAKTEPIIYLDVTETRNFLAGNDFSSANQVPIAQRAFEPYAAATALQYGVQWVRVPTKLDAECHTCIRQNMPLPITIRAHIPAVGIGEPIS
jgi:hypothetical protein